MEEIFPLIYNCHKFSSLLLTLINYGIKKFFLTLGLLTEIQIDNINLEWTGSAGAKTIDFFIPRSIIQIEPLLVQGKKGERCHGVSMFLKQSQNMESPQHCSPFSPGIRGSWIQTLELGIISQLFYRLRYHCWP